MGLLSNQNGLLQIISVYFVFINNGQSSHKYGYQNIEKSSTRDESFLASV